MESKKISVYVGRFLRKSRKNKNMTGKELAFLMNVSQQQISRYETAKTKITLEKLNIILNLLDKTWVDLISIIQFECELEENK